MKALLTLIASAGLLLACHKNKNANDLVGKWKLTETYRIGQPWQAVHTTAETTLTFNNNYTYTLVPPAISSFSGCTGRYRITDKTTVMMTSSCQQNPAYEEEFGFTRDGNTLIMDHRTTSSGVKSKYVKL